MRALLQRVTGARVVVGGDTIGAIDRGLAIFLGIGRGDDEAVARQLARKVGELRIFADDADKMNRSVVDIGGGCLVVSQFTLYADCRKGRRPFFGDAEEPTRAAALCDVFTAALREQGVRVETGRFGAMMQVDLTNDGPVTIWLDTGIEQSYDR